MDKYIQNHGYGSFQVKKDQQIIDSYTYVCLCTGHLVFEG